MITFIRDTAVTVLAVIIVNVILSAWDGMRYPVPTMSEPVSPITLMPTAKPTYEPPRNVAAAVPTRTPAPTPARTEGIIYLFNLAPVLIWFNKSDALAYREAILDGKPTREFISLEKSRTLRGGRMILLKQEDDLIMIKAEDTNIVGWIQ